MHINNCCLSIHGALFGFDLGLLASSSEYNISLAISNNVCVFFIGLGVEKKYDISEALKFVLLPDGNTTDIGFYESEDENEHLFENFDDDNELQNVLPIKIGCLDWKLKQMLSVSLRDLFKLHPQLQSVTSSFEDVD